MIIDKLLVLDRNTWNDSTVHKLMVLELINV